MTNQPMTEAGRSLHWSRHGDPDEPMADQDDCGLTEQIRAIEREAIEPLRIASQAFLDAAALESMTKAPDYIKAKRRLRAVLAKQAAR